MRRTFLAILTLLLSACVVNPGPVVTPATPMATLGVEVRDRSTGSAVAGAHVTVHTGEKASTDSNGYASFEIVTGERGVDVVADGFIPAAIEVNPFASNTHAVAWLLRYPPPEPPTPSAPTHPNPLVGRLRIDGGCFRDDTGCVLPLYAHAGDFFSAYVRDRAKIQAQLDLVAAAGYHGVRVWSTLGCGVSELCPPGTYWRGREVGPGVTPEYWGQVESFFRELLARKLRVVWSQGDVAHLGDRRAFMEQLVALEARVGAQVVDWIDCGNEAWQTGEPDPRKLSECVGYYKNAGGQALLTLTSPPGEEKAELDAFSIAPADAYDVHSDRGGRWFDKRRHIFSIPYEGKPSKPFGINSEPPGGGELVSASSNKQELDDEAVASLGVTAAYARQAWVWFSGEGVKIDKGLQGEPGFASTPRWYAHLPKDVATFGTLHHSGDSWKGTRVLASMGELRIDGRISADGRFVYTIDGPPGAYSVRVERGFDGSICDMVGCVDASRNAGDTLVVTFTRARLLVGRVR